MPWLAKDDRTAKLLPTCVVNRHHDATAAAAVLEMLGEDVQMTVPSEPEPIRPVAQITGAG